ncbi:type I-F CRISPR-associated endoribonuclease Cas6/Csy4 [Photobacterium sp. SDRW27]|uniref:type I-F CRISPR-associated endoribonuclease Cas6/Csy4 n=1 Tax=Photobacterium obscurum TaxID=2829490 RepID=UPI002242C8D9|nr:type I-F CRISPR-associated endoribonuclease Cas6/Csy4 [Photobacterium obscurum]MCW8332093.1 type I-F CRISPR-associated endoribonuclease Cas6/Csy4 [Photobacterium obscurum]
MDHYLDIRVEPDLEITAPALMNNLFAKFHRTMAQVCHGRVAVSFPYHARTLGDVLRLHGRRDALELLMAQPWLKGLRDYTRVGEILPVPREIEGYRCVSRVQKKSPRNLRRRSVAKGWLTEEEALQQIPDSRHPQLTLPYLQLQSLSSKNVMRIYIRHGEISQLTAEGEYSSYGLSRQATIPWF